MKIKAVFCAAAILMPMLASAAEYQNAAGVIPGLNSGTAAGQLQSFIPDGGDPTEFGPASPPAAGLMAERSQGSGDGGANRIFSENDPWHKRLAEALGIGYPCAVESKHIGRPTQATEKMTFDDGKRTETVVVKRIRAGGTGDVIGGFARRVIMGAKSPSKIKELDTPGMIMKNGVVMNEKFKAAGFKTLDIVLFDAENMVLVTKFLKGTDMPSILQAIPAGDAAALRLMEKLGSVLAAAHREDLCVGDLNTGNVMFVEGEPYFIDVDLAMSGKANGWDIANVLYSHYILDGTSEPRWAAETARTFLKGYLAGGGDKRIVKDALSRKHQVPLLGAMVASPNLSHRRHQARAVQIEMKKAAEAPVYE